MRRTGPQVKLNYFQVTWPPVVLQSAEHRGTLVEYVNPNV